MGGWVGGWVGETGYIGISRYEGGWVGGRKRAYLYSSQRVLFGCERRVEGRVCEEVGLVLRLGGGWYEEVEEGGDGGGGGGWEGGEEGEEERGVDFDCLGRG